jgi:hypothetical protein
VEKKSKAKSKSKGRKFPKGSQRKGYVQASPAICLVVHDLGGMGISDKIANEILEVVTERAIKYGYVVNYTRQ